MIVFFGGEGGGVKGFTLFFLVNYFSYFLTLNKKTLLYLATAILKLNNLHHKIKVTEQKKEKREREREREERERERERERARKREEINFC